MQAAVRKLRVRQTVAEEISGGVGHIHILRKADAFPLVPCGAIGMVVINGNLSCVPGHAHRKLSAGIVLSRQHLHDGFRTHFGGIPCLQNRIQVSVCRIA